MNEKLLEAFKNLAAEQEWSKRRYSNNDEVVCGFEHDGKRYFLSIEEPVHKLSKVTIYSSDVYLGRLSQEITYNFAEAAEMYREIKAMTEEKKKAEAVEKIIELSSPDGVGPKKPWYRVIVP